MITAGKSTKIHQLFLLTLLISGVFIADCNDPANHPDNAYYSSGTKSPGGTGRYYMGRQIGTVMSHLNAGKLDRPERESQQRTDLLVDLLVELLLVRNSSGTVIADVGAGSGYFTLRLARQLPEARVLAIDVQPEMLTIIRQRADSETLPNVEFIAASERASGLSEQSADLILLIDTYHEFSWPREYMQDLRRALKPGGTVVIVEQRAERSSGRLVPTHRMLASQVIAEMKSVDLELRGSQDALPAQHFLTFQPANESPDTP